MPPMELFPPPHGALTAIVSGVAVRWWSTTRHNALANTTKPKPSSAGSRSGVSASNGTRPGPASPSACSVLAVFLIIRAPLAMLSVGHTGRNCRFGEDERSDLVAQRALG